MDSGAVDDRADRVDSWSSSSSPASSSSSSSSGPGLGGGSSSSGLEGSDRSDLPFEFDQKSIHEK